MGSCHSAPSTTSDANISASQPIQVKEKSSSDEETKENIDSANDQQRSEKQSEHDDDEKQPDADTEAAAAKLVEETKSIDEHSTPAPATLTANVDGLQQATPQLATAEPAAPVQTRPTEAPVAPASPVAAAEPASFATSDGASSTGGIQFDEEFKSTVKSVLLLLLDRLTRTMEYQRAAFSELAAGVGLTNYMELFDYKAFEKLLRDNFSIPSSPAPMPSDDDGKQISQYFNLFLSLAQNGTITSDGTRNFPSRLEFTKDFQSLCQNTSKRFLQFCASPHAGSEVKDHLIFFSKALEFSNGDLINNPRLLYKNIDEICE